MSPRTHEFRIRSQGVDWNWLAYNGNDVAKYSGSLGRQVKEDKQIASSTVQLCEGVSEDALKIIVSSIPSKYGNEDLPVLHVNERDLERGFDELLSLAIACWKYDCAIPSACKKFADDFYGTWMLWNGHDFYKGGAGRQNTKAINWMFIAHVFGWDEIFAETSQVVVSKYNTTDDNPNLPRDFQG